VLLGTLISFLSLACESRFSAQNAPEIQSLNLPRSSLLGSFEGVEEKDKDEKVCLSESDASLLPRLPLLPPSAPALLRLASIAPRLASPLPTLASVGAEGEGVHKEDEDSAEVSAAAAPGRGENEIGVGGREDEGVEDAVQGGRGAGPGT